MRHSRTVAIAAITLLAVAVPMAHAQKGVGDPTGVARQSVKPEIISLSGKIIEVKTGPCESTTGPSVSGTHLLLETVQKERLNVHLGPAEAVADTVASLSVGQKIAVKAFRTEKMKEKHYVAQTLTFETTVELRDAGLRPVWAGGNVGPRRTAASQAGLGRGRGPGWGRGGPWWLALPEREPAAIKEPAGKIAVTAAEPSMDAPVDPQFGRCPYLILVDKEGDTFEILKNSNTARGNAGVQAAEMIAAKGAKVLLTGKCGPSASEALAAAGIQVVPGCSGTVCEVVRQFKAGRLQPLSKNKATTERVPNKESATPKQGGSE